MKTLTCNLMKQRAWQHIAAFATFVPSYPTSISTRGNDDQNEGASPGTR
jgi:hypothetical protein